MRTMITSVAVSIVLGGSFLHHVRFSKENPS